MDDHDKVLEKSVDDSKTLQLTYSGLAANVVDQGVAKATDVA